jgi:hypothetical protein
MQGGPVAVEIIAAYVKIILIRFLFVRTHRPLDENSKLQWILNQPLVEHDAPCALTGGNRDRWATACGDAHPASSGF